MSRPPQQRPHRRERGTSDDRDERGAGNDRAGYQRRYTRRYREDEVDTGAAPGSDPQRDTGGRTPERAHGGRRSLPGDERQGSPRSGSQRGEESVQNPAGRVGRQFGDLHGPRPSERQAGGYHAEEQFAGSTGRSAHDRRYGSRRGHGSQRREDARTPTGRDPGRDD